MGVERSEEEEKKRSRSDFLTSFGVRGESGFPRR